MDPAKLFAIAERGGYRMNLEGRQAMEHAIENGRGAIWLELDAGAICEAEAPLLTLLPFYFPLSYRLFCQAAGVNKVRVCVK